MSFATSSIYADDGYDNGGCDKNDFVDELNFHNFFSDMKLLL